MPNIDWGSVEEKRSGGGVSSLPSGAYKCRITKASYVRTKRGQSALLVVWDVADGEYRDHFADGFFADKDFRHNDYLMLEGKALGITKHKLHALADSNAGFKPSDAVAQDLAQPFVGKTCYLLLQERKYTYNGRDQSETRVVDWLSPDEFSSGDVKVPETIDDREKKTPEAQQVVHAPDPAPVPVADEDIPF